MFLLLSSGVPKFYALCYFVTIYIRPGLKGEKCILNVKNINGNVKYEILHLFRQP